MQITKQPKAISVEDLLFSLETKQDGLSDKEIESRLSKYGNNSFHSKEKKNAVSIF